MIETRRSINRTDWQKVDKKRFMSINANDLDKKGSMSFDANDQMSTFLKA